MAHLVVHDTTDRLVLQASAEVQREAALDPESDQALDATLACAALELVAIVGDASTIDRAAVVAANRVKDFLKAEGVALAVSGQSGRCRLAAISGTAQINRGSELSRAIEDALVRAAHGDSAAQNAAAELGGLLPGAKLVCQRLATQEGRTGGAILAWGISGGFNRNQSERFLCGASEPLASALLLQSRTRKGPLIRALNAVLGTRYWLLWAALSLVVLVALCLLPYRVTCDCAAEPITRRFVSAPFAGVFEKSLVRPGDIVEKDSLLGQMDGRELRIELATLTANYEQARKSRDVNLAAGKVAQDQIDRLELERLDQQRSLLEHRIANLAIRSPVAGYVIGGDLKRTEGAPLTVGQVLYEIAPLDQMIVEVAIADDDIALVVVGQSVSIRFDAHAGEKFAGRLLRIHPRSETRDSRNVFIGEVTLDEAAGALRPGMKGRASIAIDGKSLAGGLCQRAWHTIAMFVGL